MTANDLMPHFSEMQLAGMPRKSATKMKRQKLGAFGGTAGFAERANFDPMMSRLPKSMRSGQQEDDEAWIPGEESKDDSFSD